MNLIERCKEQAKRIGYIQLQDRTVKIVAILFTPVFLMLLLLGLVYAMINVFLVTPVIVCDLVLYHYTNKTIFSRTEWLI